MAGAKIYHLPVRRREDGGELEVASISKEDHTGGEVEEVGEDVVDQSWQRRLLVGCAVLLTPFM